MTNIGAMEESGPLEGGRAAKNQCQAQLSFTFAGAEVGREQCARKITSLLRLEHCPRRVLTFKIASEVQGRHRYLALTGATLNLAM